MHEQATIKDLVSTVLHVAEENDAKRVVRIKVRLGALSHFTPSTSTSTGRTPPPAPSPRAAKVEAELSEDLTDPQRPGRRPRRRRDRARL